MLLCVAVENDPIATDYETSKMLDDIKLMDSPGIEATIPAAAAAPGLTKGDPITMGAIALAAVAGGGAIARAVSPGGFCSKLAELIFERSTRTVSFHIVTPQKTKIDLVGSADDIEKVLKAYFVVDRHG
jgi:hypothetical protein